MKHISKLFLLLGGLVLLLSACDKVDSLPYYAKGAAPVLTASTTTIASAPADSSKTALTLSWTSPDYATDSATYKYVVQIDTAGGNFAKAATRTVAGVMTTSFTAKELNDILLGYGFAFGQPKDMQVRIVSSYANNNEQYASNIIKIKMTPYKVPPKIPLPTTGRLFIVGSATQGDWSNPVPVPSQELTRIDETTFGGIFNLNGGGEYLILPANGDWGNKYSVADNTVAGLNMGGNFGFNLKDNIPGPATSGWYKVIFDFQSGMFTVTPYTGTLPGELYIVGDATAGGWDNPVPVPSQKFTRINSTVFELTLPLTGGKQYLLLPVNGSWDNKFSVEDNTIASLKMGGTFKANASDNFPGPDASGTYKITVNFLDNTYTVTKQ